MDYDVIIHGGGIHGVATSLDCVLRGLKVLLVDKYDFGFGASTNNSKLIHGGLRYLEQFAFSLVRESLHERSWLLHNAKGYVTPLPFLLPLYKGEKPSSFMMTLGLSFYDLLAKGGLPKNPLPNHRKLSIEKTIELMPLLERKELQGAFLFFDSQMDDRRLLFAMLRAAIELGLEALNWSDVPKEAKGKVHFYALGGFEQEKNIPLLRTKGVHLVFPSLDIKEALLLRAPQDGRVFFIIPWLGKTLVGTTDTPYGGDPRECHVEKEDVDYLMTAFCHYFPKKEGMAPLSAFSGLRPLLRREGKNPSDLSRRYQWIDSGNELRLIGGKYTTYRIAAMQSTDRIEAKIRGRTSESGLEKWVFPSYIDPTFEEALDKEKVVHLDDWYFRRTATAYTHGLSDSEEKSRILQKKLGLSEEERKEEINRCLRQLSQNRLM